MEVEVERQRNGYDCGIYVLAFAEAFIHRLRSVTLSRDNSGGRAGGVDAVMRLRTLSEFMCILDSMYISTFMFATLRKKLLVFSRIHRDKGQVGDNQFQVGCAGVFCSSFSWYVHY